MNLKYTNVLTSGKEILILKPDSSYKYVWYRYYDVGPINDTITHNGWWHKENDTLFLNSYVLPTNYNSIYVEESVDSSSDSITIIIDSFDTIPFFMFAPTEIRINDNYYSVKIDTQDLIRLTLPYSHIKYIIIPRYPIHQIENQKNNVYHISLKDFYQTKYLYPENTYFFNEKFIVKGDSLFQIMNDRVKGIFIKK